jgi:hypothetical protein
MIRISLLAIILLTFHGCTTSKNLKKTFQTTNAYEISYAYKQLITTLLHYKNKLDKRNPKNIHPKLAQTLPSAIRQNIPPAQLRHLPLTHFDNPGSYLEYAFAKDPKIKYRNEYLLFGLYAMLYETFRMDAKHKLTALDYKLEKLQKLHENLQILQWRIKYAKDSNGNYLFLTWQNNWQVELAKKSGSGVDYDLIEELYYLKSAQESIYDPSNLSFEVLTSKMLTYTELAIKHRGGEVRDLSIELLPTLLFGF